MRNGSTITGYPSSANKEARFESANRRYGVDWRRLAAIACTSGLVQESKKKDSPTEEPSAPRIIITGFSPPEGFHRACGSTVRKMRLTANSVE